VISERCDPVSRTNGSVTLLTWRLTTGTPATIVSGTIACLATTQAAPAAWAGARNAASVNASQICRFRQDVMVAPVPLLHEFPDMLTLPRKPL
jgi:hypothetical protein